MFVDASKINLDAVQRALALGYEVTFLETDLFRTVYADDTVMAKLAGARHVSVSGLADGPAAMATARQIHAERPLDGIVTMLEQNVLGVARLAREMGVRGTSLEGVANARNKSSTRSRLAESGLASCRHAVVAHVERLPDAVARLGLPVIAKPVSGYGKFVTRLLADGQAVEGFIAEVAALRDRLHPIDRQLVSEEMIVEQVIEGPMYSVEIGVDERGIYPFIVTERRRPDNNLVLELGSTMPTGAKTAYREDLADYASRVVRALGLDIGIFHLEIIYGKSGPVLVEANPRLMGGTLPLLYMRSTGRNVFDDLIRIHAGQPIDWRAGQPMRYATVRQVAPVTTGVSRDNLDPESLQRAHPTVEWSSVKFRKDDVVRPMTCNVQSLGCFHVVADSYTDSLQRANEVLDHIEQRLGVEVAR